MDGVSGVGTINSYVPQFTATPATTSVSVPSEADSVSLSGGDASGVQATVYAPDAGFTALLQSDPGLAQDYAADAQFGYTDDVLASDDTLTSTDQSTAADSSVSQDALATAEKVDLSALNFTGGVASALFGASDSSSVFFMGASMSNLLTSQGSAALAYLTPQAAAQSSSVDLTA